MLALNGGKPEQLDLKQLPLRLHRLPRGGGRAPHRLRAAQGARAAHLLCGLAVAVENVDEVVRTIRSSPDAGRGARAAEGDAPGRPRRSPTTSALIDDPTPQDQRGRHLPPVGHAGPRDPRPAPAAADRDGRARDRRGAGGAGRRDQDHLDILRSRERIMAIISAELARRARAVRRPRAGSEFVDYEGDLEDEDLIEREDMVVTVTPWRLHQAHAADRVPHAGARRQGPGRHGDQGRGLRHPPVRRQHAHAAPDLHRPTAWSTS